MKKIKMPKNELKKVKNSILSLQEALSEIVAENRPPQKFDFIWGLFSGTFSERLKIEIFTNFASFLGMFRHFMGIF